MTIEAQDVIDRLARQVSDMAVRLAVAEARADNAERSLVDALAEQESDDGAS